MDCALITLSVVLERGNVVLTLTFAVANTVVVMDTSVAMAAQGVANHLQVAVGTLCAVLKAHPVVQTRNTAVQKVTHAVMKPMDAARRNPIVAENTAVLKI